MYDGLLQHMWKGQYEFRNAYQLRGGEGLGVEAVHGGGVDGGLGDPEEGWTPRRGRGVAIGWTILGIETLSARALGLDPTCRVYLLRDTSLISSCASRCTAKASGRGCFVKRILVDSLRTPSPVRTRVV